MRVKGCKKIIISVVIVLCVIMQFFNIESSVLENVKQDKKLATESNRTITEPQIEYNVVSTEGTNAKILIKITDETNGIEKVEYPDGNIVYCNGNEKRQQLSFDYEVELGEEYIYKVTTGDGVEIDKKILVINNYTVLISNITTTGFKIDISGLTEKEISKIENIRYYVDTSPSGTNYQDSDIVTGLSPRTQRYVWAEIIYNDGGVKRSSNYQNVYTQHTHSDELSCYSEYKLGVKYSLSRKSSLGYNTGYYKWMCSNCGSTGTGTSTPLYYVYYNQGGYVNINGNNTYTDICCENCNALGTLTYGDGPKSYATAYDYGCDICGKVYCAWTVNSKGVTTFKCYHSYVKNLVDVIPESGIAYSYNF